MADPNTRTFRQFLTSRIGTVLLNVLLAGLYFGTARLGLLFATTNDQVTLLWPPSGIALAFVFLGGYRCLPGVVVGALLANVGPGMGILFPVAASIGGSLEVTVATLILRQMSVSPRFRRTRDVVGMAAACSVGASVAAIIGSVAFALAGLSQWPEAPLLFAQWAAGDLLGMLVVGTFAMTLVTGKSRRRSTAASSSSSGSLVHGSTSASADQIGRGVGFTILSAALFVAGWLVFGSASSVTDTGFVVIMGLLMLAAFLFGPREVSITLLCYSIGAAFGLRWPPAGVTNPAISSWSVITALLVAHATVQTIAASLAEQKATHGRLTESEARYRELVEGTDSLVTTVDSSGAILFVNHKAVDFWGVDPSDCLGTSAFDYIHPDDREKTHLEFGRWVENHQTKVSIYNRQIHTDGSSRTMLWTIGLIYDESGELSRVHSVARDISAMVEAERFLRDHQVELEAEVEMKTQQLREREAALLDAQQLAGLGTMVSSERNSGAQFSSEMTDILGANHYGRTQPQGTYQSFVHPEDKAAVAALIDEVNAHGGPIESRHRIVRLDGSIRYVITRARRADTPDGKYVLIATVQDVTEVIETARAAEESEQKYRAVFESAGDALFVHDIEGHITDANQLACDRLGYTRDEMLSMTVADLDAPEFVPEIPKLIAQVLDKGGVQFETVQVTKGGVQVPVWVNSRAIKMDDATVVLSIARDISKRKRLENELRELATTDPLTGTLNRRAFYERCDDELKRSVRYKHSVSVLALDLDHFKTVNDTYGHGTGDKVLTEVAAAVRTVLRESDLLGRLGGEEFAVLLPETDMQHARDAAERIRHTVERLAVNADGQVIAITTSIGRSQAQDTDTVDTLIKRADEALYRAKAAGRNCVAE